MNEPPTPSSPPGRSGNDLPPGPTISAGVPFRPSNPLIRLRRSVALRLLLAALLTLLGLLLHWPLLAVPSALLLLGLCLAELLPDLWRLLADRLDEAPLARLLAIFGLVVSVLAVPLALGWFDRYLAYYRTNNWEAIGAIGEGVIGAFGQILVALVAVAIAWRQVLIEQRLTTQQNRITQAQTIDSFIQGISELIVDEEGCSRTGRWSGCWRKAGWRRSSAASIPRAGPGCCAFSPMHACSRPCAATTVLAAPSLMGREITRRTASMVCP